MLELEMVLIPVLVLVIVVVVGEGEANHTEGDVVEVVVLEAMEGVVKEAVVEEVAGTLHIQLKW